MRPSRRQPDELRAVSLDRGVVKYAEGSCFVKFGDTHVLVTATLEDRLPPWLKGQARGWVTAEYGMLPRATNERTRARIRRKRDVRFEIRGCRRSCARASLPARRAAITVDCDVSQADAHAHRRIPAQGRAVGSSTDKARDWCAAASARDHVRRCRAAGTMALRYRSD